MHEVNKHQIAFLWYLAVVVAVEVIKSLRFEGLDDVLDLLPAQRTETTSLVLPMSDGAAEAEAHVTAAVQHRVHVCKANKTH